MSSGVLRFSCPNCSVTLTVPESMAGITGPCPKCASTITAPAPASLAQPPQASAPAAPADPASTRLPLPTTLPEPRQPSGRESSIRPQPRELPGREQRPQIAARHSTADPGLRKRKYVSARKPRRSRPRTLSIILPALITALSLTLVYFLLYYFLPGGPGHSSRKANRPPTPTERQSSPESPRATPDTTASPNRSTLPPAENTTSAKDAIAANEVIETFLKAPSLDERLYLIDPQMSRAELQSTVAGGPLPEVVNLISEETRHDPVENLTVFPYRVAFAGSEGSVEECTMLVMKRGTNPPKVAINPFLDLAGGRLATFSATPNSEIGTFHAIIEAIPRCFDSNVPNKEKKFTYKLSASDHSREITRAYASLSSDLAKQLQNSSSPLRWGIRMRATVVLAWNLTEDPERPYLEVVKIKDLHWNS